MSVPGSNSPFLAAGSFEVAELGEEGNAPRPPDAAPAFESPFLRSYRAAGEDGPADPETEEYTAFLGELHDDRLDEALFQLAADTAGQYADISAGRNGAVYTDPTRIQQLVDDQYAPVVRQLEATLDSLADATDQHTLRSLDEGRIEALFESFAPPDGAFPSGSPSFEFLFGIGKALKSVVKKAAGLAVRGVKAVAKLALGPLLRRLKPIAVALLKKALAAGLKWLPPELRPYAARLAQRLPLLREAEADEDADAPAAVDATGDVRELQREFDVQVADAVFADTESAMELQAAQYVRDTDRALARTDPVEELARAREEFVARLAEAEDGADVTPHLEAFLPAMLPVLKFALKATGGRSALVSTLAKFLAPLITRFVGKQAGAALSRALVEAGLRLVNLETAPEDEQRAAGTAVASVVEDTVRNVAALPAHVLGDETLLEGFVLEASSGPPPAASRRSSPRRPTSTVRTCVRTSPCAGRGSRCPCAAARTTASTRACPWSPCRRITRPGCGHLAVCPWPTCCTPGSDCLPERRCGRASISTRRCPAPRSPR